MLRRAGFAKKSGGLPIESALTCRRVQASVSDKVAPQAAAGSLRTERCLVTDLPVGLLKVHTHAPGK